MKRAFAGVLMATSFHLCAQDSTLTSASSVNPLTVSGYAEAYYSYDFNKPSNNTKPGFLYNVNRHNEFNLNLGFVKAAYAKNKARANLAIGLGTYMNANYASEPGTLKNIFEANAGYKLSAKKNLWFDIGILPSHIGFEAAVGKDNWTLTRSLVAENSPYFEGGARVLYTSDNGRVTIAGLLLNGWQRIQRLEGSSLMNFGTQLSFKPSDKITFNYNTFVGTDKPDSAKLLRYYHNVYGIFQFSSKVGLVAGFDIGLEDQTPFGTGSNTWYTPVGIVRYTPSSKWAIALRGEYFSDEKGVIVATGTPNGCKTTGASFNVDYRPQPNVALRLEGRTFVSKDAIFAKGSGLTDNRTAVTFSTAISF